MRYKRDNEAQILSSQDANSQFMNDSSQLEPDPAVM